ncbi:MAG: hypothetical protein V4619_17295 [Bacteroidota bacterium]
MIRKFSLSALLIIGVVASGMAQSNSRPQFNISADAGSQVSNRYREHSSVFGGALGFKYPVSANAAVAFSAGYTAFVTAEKVVGGDIIVPETFHAIPLKAGVRYYLFKGLFGEGQVGAAIGTNKNARSGFLYTPGIGYEFTEGYSFGIRYESWLYRQTQLYNKSQLNHIAFRFSYAF